MWDNKDYIRVMLKDLIVETHVGLHPWEQHPQRPTRIIVNVELFAHLNKSNHARADILDYDEIRNNLKTWSKRPHTPLLETLVEEVIEMCFKNPKVEACKVSIIKPDIFNEAAGAGVEIYRTRK